MPEKHNFNFSFLKIMLAGFLRLIRGNPANEDPHRRATYMSWDDEGCKSTFTPEKKDE